MSSASLTMRVYEIAITFMGGYNLTRVLINVKDLLDYIDLEVNEKDYEGSFLIYMSDDETPSVRRNISVQMKYGVYIVTDETGWRHMNLGDFTQFLVA